MGKAPLIENGIDFTEDSAMETGPTTINTFAGEAKPPLEPVVGKEKKTQELSSAPTSPVISEFKNPVMSLNELKPGLAYECSETGATAATKRFVTTVTVDNIKFEGTGSSKKFSKQACARAALSKLYGVNFVLSLSSAPASSGKEKVVVGTGIPLSKFSMDQEVADKVAKLVLEKFEGLTIGNMVASRRKVIAGIVQSRGENMSELTVVSVTTGQKFFSRIWGKIIKSPKF